MGESMSVPLYKEGDYITIVRGDDRDRSYKITDVDSGLNYHVKAPTGFRAVFTEEELEDVQCRLATREEIKWYFVNKLDSRRAKYDEKIARIKATIETLE
jgi:hypothetical protein